MNTYHPDKLPPDELDDVPWHALNYRTAGIKQAEDMWQELEACIDRKVAAAVAAERERCAKLCESFRMPTWVETRGDVRDALAEAIRAGDTAP